MWIEKRLIIKEYFPSLSDCSHSQIISSLYEHSKEIKYSHKIKGRWENQYLSIEFVPQIKKILHLACRISKDIISRPVFIPYKEMGLPMNEFWFNIAGEGESTGWHDHKEHAILSGVYYLQVPNGCGDIHFRKKVDGLWEEWSVRSETGKMILFDSFIQHAVPINTSKSKRISIGFNLYLFPLKSENFTHEYSSDKFYH